MSRIRLSTTVDEVLLVTARAHRSGSSDAAVIDEALRALLDRDHAADIDASYTGYDDHPIDEPDAWVTWARSDVRPVRRDGLAEPRGGVVV